MDKKTLKRKTPNKPIKKSKKRRRKVNLLKILVCLLVLIVLFSGGSYYMMKTGSQPVDPNTKESQLVDIPEGSSVKSIASLLKEKDLIKNKRVFVKNVRDTGKAEKIKAGKYKLSKNMDNDKIIDKLVRGQIYQDGVKFTIPEGSISTDIVAKLVAKGLGQREKFVDLYRNPSKFADKFPFLKDTRIATLEGFLYPETYYFKKGTSEKEIFEKMLSEFSRVYKASVEPAVKKNNYNFYDTIIMASIVEKEAVNDEDRDTIAGIFYNRLDKKMRLQSDAVLQYGLPQRKGRVLYSDLKVESPYNLYLNKGLPPTPVASPGKKSMVAAANPKKTDYLYFVTNVNGKNSYSKTFEEHKVSADKYRKEAYGEQDAKAAQKSKEESTTEKSSKN